LRPKFGSRRRPRLRSTDDSSVGGPFPKRAPGSLVVSRLARGREAERIVAEHLRSKGFTISHQNLRLGALELDIVAKRGRLCVICEVRSLSASAWAHPAETIDDAKRDRVRQAARALLAQPEYRGFQLRLDVAAVTFGEEPTIDYYENAL